MKPYAFGVDIGGTTIKMGFFGTDGKFLDKWEITTRTENNGEKVLPDSSRTGSFRRHRRSVCQPRMGSH